MRWLFEIGHAAWACICAFRIVHVKDMKFTPLYMSADFQQEFRMVVIGYILGNVIHRASPWLYKKDMNHKVTIEWATYGTNHEVDTYNALFLGDVSSTGFGSAVKPMQVGGE